MANSKPVIIDTDVALDDWMAILYLLMRPDVDILGVTTTGVGAAHLSYATANVQSVLLVGGQPDIPVAQGGSAPLIYSNVFPGSWRTLVDKAYGLDLPENPNPLQSASAVEFLQSTILGASSPVSILSIGGGTNLGKLFQQASPEIMQQLTANIDRIYMMGGVINPPNPPGNVNAFNPDYNNTVAEWNIFIDVLGAQYVLGSGVPITLVPLNACNQAPLTMDFYNLLQRYIEWNQNMVSGAVQLTFAGLSKNLSTIQQGQYFFWDPLAAMVLTDNSLVQTEVMQLSVTQTLDEEKDSSGLLYNDPSAPAIDVAMQVPSSDAVLSLFFETITGGGNFTELMTRARKQ